MTWSLPEPRWADLYIPDPPGRQSAGTPLLVDDAATVVIPAQPESDPLICYCFGVPERLLKQAALQHELHEVADLTAHTRAGGGCGSCHPDLEDLLRELWREVEARGYVVLCHELGVTPGGLAELTTDDSLAAAYDSLPGLAKVARITDVLNKEVRPYLQGDGGDLTLIDVDGDRVIVHLIGSCSSCAASTLTLRGLVEERLRQYVSPRLEVIAV